MRFLIAASLILAFSTPSWAQLEAFGSSQELAEYLEQAPAEESPSYNSCDADSSCLEEVAITGAVRAAPTSITNTQHAGVDEGDIVKQHGDHLVVLRRGRLFTIDISGSRLRPVSSVNAFAPGMDPDGTWYDEMLISNDKIVVIGYSYQRDGTEIGIFNITRNGKLRHEATYHFHSHDYYSARNYASRLIGNKLILYSPLSLQTRSDDPLDILPAMKRWRDGGEDDAYKPTITARHIFRVPGVDKPPRGAVLHAVTVCDLAARELSCESTGVIGRWGRVFYVSPTAMYVWSDVVPAKDDNAGPPSVLYRMPLNGDAPGALRVWGGPVDQFSFDETSDGVLNVLVRSEANGDAMWASEVSEGDVALLRLPVGSFGDGSQPAPDSAYLQLPRPGDEASFHNRFVEDYVLYGTGDGWWERDDSDHKVYIAHVKTGRVTEIALPHGVERLEVLGRNAIVMGSDEHDLHFTGVRLTGKKTPEIVQRYALKGAAEGESRSHAFFYSPDPVAGGGIFAMPVRKEADPRYEQLFSESTAVVYVRDLLKRFQPLGSLGAHDGGALDDQCESSCVDWYGNSRPVFIGDRVFALMGYELVEGQPGQRGISEVARVNFAPKVQITQAD